MPAPTPMMTPAEVTLLEALLLSRIPPVRVLEWGSGESTLYFTSFLEKSRREYRWDSVESDSAWEEYTLGKSRELGLSNVEVHLVNFHGVNPRQRPIADELRDAYVGMVDQVAPEFDVAIIDGRFRRRCLAAARRRQAGGSVICLMDAERTHYLCDERDSQSGTLIPTGISPFRAREKRKALWIGCETEERLALLRRDVIAAVDLPALVRRSEAMHREAWDASLLTRITRRVLGRRRRRRAADR